jgi:hypothetical protein
MFRNLIRPNLTARRIALVAAPLAILGAVVPAADAADRDGRGGGWGWSWGHSRRPEAPAVVIHATIGGPIVVSRPAPRVIYDEVPAGLQLTAYQSKDRVIVLINGTNRAAGFRTSLSALGDTLVLHNIAPEDGCRGGPSSFTLSGSICSPRELHQVCVRIGDRSFEVPVTCVPALT